MIFDQLLTLAYVALAMILGAAIGFERESADKPAGLRTHMLVAGVAALFAGCRWRCGDYAFRFRRVRRGDTD